MDLSPLLNMDPAHLFIAGGLLFVARTMRRVNKDVLMFFGNHLSDIVETQERTAAALQRLCDKLDENNDLIREARWLSACARPSSPGSAESS